MAAEARDRPIEAQLNSASNADTKQHPTDLNVVDQHSQGHGSPSDTESEERTRNTEEALLPTIAPKQSPGHADVGKVKWDMETVRAYLREEVDTDAATGPLAAFCFMTGYIDSVAFTACYIWCAFQTGNTIQLSLALARLFSGPQQGPAFRMPDRQALVSLVSFLGGSFLGRIGDRYGAKSRGWLAFGTLIQAGLTMAAALCAIYAHQSGVTDSRADPSWTDALGFLALAFASASMGLQALLGTRIGAHFATTVVLTSIWVQVISDPVLFKLKRIYKQRDYKFLAIFSLFCGGLVGRALTGTIGPAATLGIGAGLRLFITGSWLFVSKAKKKA